MHRTHLKSFIFEFFLLEIIVRPFTSLMAKSKVFNVLASKLEHFKNDIHFCRDIKHTVTLIHLIINTETLRQVLLTL